jgi:peptidoglycan/LPS O-acetylase OafA/YrhL
MRYNPALDGVRAIAVLSVVAYHCRVPGFSGGFFGVDVFFVLSGFLITSLLQAELQERIDPSLGILRKAFSQTWPAASSSACRLSGGRALRLAGPHRCGACA